MALYWIMGRAADGRQSYFIGEARAPIFATLRASMAGLDGTAHREFHELDDRTARKIPKGMRGRVLSQREAQRLLAKLGR